jgi:HSP20 family protein
MTLPTRRGRYSARRWDPFAGFAGFDNLFDQMSRMLTSAFPEAARISVNSWAPPVDIEETDEAYLVEADLPGVRPEDVEIDLQGRELRIRGEYGTAEQGEGEAQRLRRTGHFDYRLTLPGEVSSESCTADLEHGVLRLRLPKAPSSVRQRIPVQTRPGAQLGPGQVGSDQSLKNSDQPQTPTT